MPAPVDVLLLEPERDPRVLATALLDATGFAVTAVATLREALDDLRHRAFELVIAHPPVDAEGWRGIEQLQALAPLVPFGVIARTEISDNELARRGLAFALQTPVSSESLLGAVAQCLTLPPVSIERQATVRAYFSSLERADWERLVSLCAPDVIYRLPADEAGLHGMVIGRAAFRALAEQTFSAFPEPRFAMQTVRALPDGVLVRYDGTWRSAPEQRSPSVGGAVLFRFDGAYIVEIGVRVDLRRAVELRIAPHEM